MQFNRFVQMIPKQQIYGNFGRETDKHQKALFQNAIHSFVRFILNKTNGQNRTFENQSRKIQNLVVILL